MRPVPAAVPVLGLVLALAPVALPGDAVASYTVTFDATWSAATHPVDFPGALAHFSGLIGGTHDASVDFWTPGQTATTGIKNMAELGSKFPLTGEINAQITAGAAGEVISGNGIFPSPGSVSVSFDIDLAHPQVTLVTMIAPSPDWFVGVRGLPLFQNGDWVDELVVPLPPWDAGTDSGVTFNSADLATMPKDPITALTGFPFAGTGPLGTFTFTRTDDPTDPWTDLGNALAGTHGPPVLTGDGSLIAGTTLTLTLDDALENAVAWGAVGFAAIDAPFYGGVFVPDIVSPSGFLLGFGTGPSGSLALSTIWPSGLPSGVPIYVQFWLADPAGPFGYAGSNAVTATTP